MGRVQKPFEEHLKDFREIHGEKFIYPKPEDVDLSLGVKSRIEIICPEHGSFIQTINNHKNQPSGCPSCGRGNRSSKTNLTPENLEKTIKGRYGNQYKILLPPDPRYLYTELDILHVVCGSFFVRTIKQFTQNKNGGCTCCNNPLNHTVQYVELFHDTNFFL